MAAIQSPTAGEGPRDTQLIYEAVGLPAGRAEVETGIANAYKMLNPDGVLLIRAPKAVSAEYFHETTPSAVFRR